MTQADVARINAYCQENHPIGFYGLLLSLVIIVWSYFWILFYPVYLILLAVSNTVLYICVRGCDYTPEEADYMVGIFIEGLADKRAKL